MKILFVCTGNTCRSPMAQVIAEKEFGEGFQISSAGLHVWGESGASPNAAEAARLNGLNLSGHAAKQLTDDMLNEADLVLTMGIHHKEYILQDRNMSHKVFTISEYAAGGQLDVQDPFGCGLEDYILCFNQIEEYIKIIAHLLNK